MGQPLERIAKQYEIVAKIREGGMGEIYKVRHRLLDEVRVVKVLRSRYLSDAKLTARFAQEARAAIQLRHPNIVQIFDFTLDDTGAGLIVMEYIRGADLKQLIARGRQPSVALALEIARQSLRALGFLHRHGFVHRDVSPDNLMLTLDVDGRPLIKLIDLGIAKRLDSAHQLTTSGMFLGKYRYASPEHFGARGAEGVETRSDLYTFGLVLYELVTGHYPLPGEGTAQLVAGHLYRQPLEFSETDPGGRVPEVLRRALLRSLAKDPAQRFANARDFIAEIVGLQADHPVDEACCAEARELVAEEPGEDRWQRPDSTDERLNREVDAARKTRVSVEVEPPEAVPTAEGGGEPDRAASERLLKAAEAAAEEERFSDARELLAEAGQKAPADGAERGAEVEGRIAELERQAAEVAEIAGRVEALLGRGALMEADRELFQAAETYGPRAALVGVRERLDELHHEELVTEVRSLISRAEDHAEAGEYGQALEIVAKARAVAPDDAELQTGLDGSVRRYRQAREEEDRRREKAKRRVEKLVRRAGIAFESSRFDEAAADLRRALESAPGDRWIRGRLAEAEARQRRLEERRERQQQAAELLAQVEEAEKRRDVLKARLLVARALELDPENPLARARAMELDRRPIEPVLSPEAAGAADEILELRRSGETLAAWRSVQAAVEEFGDVEPFKTLQKEIADELLEDGGEDSDG